MLHVSSEPLRLIWTCTITGPLANRQPTFILSLAPRRCTMCACRRRSVLLLVVDRITMVANVANWTRNDSLVGLLPVSGVYCVVESGTLLSSVWVVSRCEIGVCHFDIDEADIFVVEGHVCTLASPLWLVWRRIYEAMIKLGEVLTWVVSRCCSEVGRHALWLLRREVISVHRLEFSC
ncbi:hypothetical protein BDU57DRAFT_523767 [Ampelomyces quisqualis]|uniref:Uncharacterized protein n=1 Tax=Ampelomyces quisqualis TaxID=50730 RepID=A0A6A5QA81_AMPQU|nr:hypothetical protein BDU57DRAFT_523767 [Ampelomyces quisqualis]